MSKLIFGAEALSTHWRLSNAWKKIVTIINHVEKTWPWSQSTLSGTKYSIFWWGDDGLFSLCLTIESMLSIDSPTTTTTQPVVSATEAAISDHSLVVVELVGWLTTSLMMCTLPSLRYSGYLLYSSLYWQGVQACLHCAPSFNQPGQHGVEVTE